MNPDLEKRIAALEQWKADRERQQIVYPLDVESVKILNRYFMRIFEVQDYSFVGAEEHAFTSYVGAQNDLIFSVGQNITWLYTVNVSTDFLTLEGGAPGYVDDTAIVFYHTPGGTLPAPLAENTTYYVRDSSGLKFKVTATPGGTAINITNTGVGRQYVQTAL